MARRRNKADAGRRKAAGLRTWRQKLDLSGTIVAGPQTLGEVVYCYRFPSRPGRVKIGYSSRGLARVAEQSTAFPERPEVLFVIHDPAARKIEEAFHIALADRQADVMGTEWFEADLEDILRISPILRRATGVEGRRRRVRMAASLALAALGVILTPATLAGWVALADGMGVLRVMMDVSRYPAQILEGDLRGAGETAGYLWRYARASEPPLLLDIAGFAHIPLLAAIPWYRWRRQAA